MSVESGVSWIPFFLESLDYQAGETAPEHLKKLPLKPSEYFKRQIYSTFWFESALLGPAIDYLSHALRWWDHWLKDKDTGLMEEPACCTPGLPDVRKRIVRG